MENLIIMIFPPSCLFCGRTGSLFCDDCLTSCGSLMSEISVSSLSSSCKVFCCLKYGGNVRACIKYSKYSSRQFSALKILTVYALRDLENMYEGFVVVPIPLSFEKYRERGFNQTLLIAQVVSRKFGIPLDNRILFRVRNTKSQYSLSRSERMDNLKGAFAADREKVKGKRILLVDDICTSGATFLEAKKTLEDIGAAEVKCFALSKKL